MEVDGFASSGEVNIYGGTVNASCASIDYDLYGGAGIGGGIENGTNARTITINGGNIKAQDGENGAGIGGGYRVTNTELNITIKDCEKIEAIGGAHAASIGGDSYFIRKYYIKRW